MKKEYELYKKALKDQTKAEYLYAIKKISNIDFLSDLIEEYIEKGYDLKELLKVRNKSLQYALINCIRKDNFIPIKTTMDSKVLKDIGFNDVILEIEYRWKTLELAIITSVYDKRVMKILLKEDELHLLYKKTKDDLILEFLFQNHISISNFRDFKGLIRSKDREKMLNRINDSYNIYNILYNHKSFDESDLKYLCHLNVSKFSVAEAYDFLNIQCYYASDRQKLLDKIISSNEAEYLYMVLMNDSITLTEQEKKLFEKKLKQTKNIEYNFYYEFYKNRDLLISILGGCIVLKNYLESKKKLFTNTKRYLEVINIVNEMVNGEEFFVDTIVEDHLFKDNSNVNSVKSNKKSLK